MATEIPIKHTESGLMKTGVYGFSWTYFFFGPFVPLFRGEVQTGFIHFILAIITGGIYSIFMWFKYNEQYMNRMITNGWVLSGSEDENRLAAGMLHISLDSNVEREKTTTNVKEITPNKTPESPEDRLQKLGDMKEKGLVDEDEFNSKKAEILKEM
jgi:hypothetical protein